MNQIPDRELMKKSIDGDGQAFATLRKVRTERRKIMAFEAFELERNKREMLRTFGGCEDT